MPNHLDDGEGRQFFTLGECLQLAEGELEGWGSHFSITGGTGHYEGAMGWMASAGSWDSMALVGELCTP